jgi:hypothetical protein
LADHRCDSFTLFTPEEFGIKADARRPGELREVIADPLNVRPPSFSKGGESSLSDLCHELTLSALPIVLQLVRQGFGLTRRQRLSLWHEFSGYTQGKSGGRNFEDIQTNLSGGCHLSDLESQIEATARHGGVISAVSVDVTGCQIDPVIRVTIGKGTQPGTR